MRAGKEANIVAVYAELFPYGCMPLVHQEVFWHHDFYFEVFAVARQQPFHGGDCQNGFARAGQDVGNASEIIFFPCA